MAIRRNQFILEGPDDLWKSTIRHVLTEINSNSALKQAWYIKHNQFQ